MGAGLETVWGCQDTVSGRKYALFQSQIEVTAAAVHIRRSDFILRHSLTRLSSMRTTEWCRRFPTPPAKVPGAFVPCVPAPAAQGCRRRHTVSKEYGAIFPLVNRQKGVPFFATRDGPICATCGIPLSISIPFIWVSRNCGQKLPEVWQSIGLSDLITLLRLRRHLSRMAMPLAKSLTDAV